MSPLFEQLGIGQLTTAQRLELLESIWASIDDESELDGLADDQKGEIDRRLANHRADPSRAVAWEQVAADARSRLKP